MAAVRGRTDLMLGLAEAVKRPAFPLALGRRSCVPTQPILLAPPNGEVEVWADPVVEVLNMVSWQGARAPRDVSKDGAPTKRRLPAVVDLDAARSDYVDHVNDVPTSFDQRSRAFTTRGVAHICVEVDAETAASPSPIHGFDFLGGE